ncbi:MAG: 4-hydroxy-tetrahydrodipicolinate reductase [Methanomicrobiales archaeon]|jgi:4-hydroxy-tetrahydrodipicolinate reductase|nr:4-hydroxy-tetrahydrodipicolinate reductase [Methanomicrobiales archaeon]
MIDAVICGAFGRMGNTISRLISESDDIRVVGGVDVRAGTISGAPVVASAEIGDLLAKTKPDVVIDFTIASAVVANVKAAAAAGSALVVGTTGISPEQRAEMDRAIMGHVPAVISTNYSIGVNIFWELLKAAAPLLKDYDVEVIEAHHRYKKDAPSGTAKTILQILDNGLGERKKCYGREGMTDRKDEIGVHVIRGGDIVGDHSVLFSGNYETITLSHHAYDRSVFAKGALQAVRWIIEKEPGTYAMADVLGLVR